MTNLTLESLAERVGRLESENRRFKRQNRRLRAAAILLVAAFGAAFWLGQAAVPKVIEAQRFVLRDAHGKELAVLGVSKGLGYRDYADPRLAPEGPTLALYDSNGKRRVAVGLTEDEQGIALYGAAGDIRAYLSPDVLGVFAEAGRGGSSLISVFGEKPQLVLRDAEGKELFSAP